MVEITFNASNDMRKDVLFFLLIMLASVADEDLAAAVQDKETDLNCTLKPWEVTLLASQLLQEKLKNLLPDVKASPTYKSELKSTSDKIARFKRRPDFRDEISLPKKTARTVAQRMQKVNIDVDVLGDEAHDDVNPGARGSVRRGKGGSTCSRSRSSC